MLYWGYYIQEEHASACEVLLANLLYKGPYYNEVAVHTEINNNKNNILENYRWDMQVLYYHIISS